MKTKLLLVVLMISGFTAFTQVLPIIHKGNYYDWKEYPGRVDFSRQKFDSTTNFKRAQFDSSAVFSEAQFHSSAVFYRAQFHSSVYFSMAQFNSSAHFATAEFHSLADFYYANFHSSVDFSFAHFDSLAIFSEAQFHSSAYFFGAHFDSSAIFINASVKKGIDFRYCELPYYLNLSGIKIIEGNVDFTNSTINEKYGKCLINIVGADIEKIKLGYSMFELYFPDSLNSDMRTNVYEIGRAHV